MQALATSRGRPALLTSRAGFSGDLRIISLRDFLVHASYGSWLPGRSYEPTKQNRGSALCKRTVLLFVDSSEDTFAESF